MTDSPHHASRQRKQRNSRRHQARILAMQMMYEADMTGHSTSEILIRTRTQGGTPDETLEYTSALLTGVRARIDAIDAEIEAVAPQYPVNELSPIDRAILEIALFEILFGEDVPPRAAINEAVGIAQEYGGEASARFVNGVLGGVIDRRFPDSSRRR
jgi:N utilization substance protein B